MLKRVNMTCNGSFSYKGKMISGVFKNIIVDSECIKKALQSRSCKVEEIICPGRTIKLGFHNYNTDNGGDTFSEEEDTFLKAKSSPKVIMCGNVNKNTIKETHNNSIVTNIKNETKNEPNNQQQIKQQISKKFDNSKQNNKK